MTFESYLNLFEDILNHPANYPDYQDEDYYQYAKMNSTRMNRWINRFEPNAETVSFFQQITQQQTWIIITEPWCGDAAHSVPMLVKLAALNPLISVDIQLRDTAPFLIDSYLTNGGKAIPKMIIRDTDNVDIAVWGPRPAACQELFSTLKAAEVEFAEIKEEIQKWYNTDKGIAIQEEIRNLLKA